MQFYTVKDHEKKAPLMPDGERPVEFDEEVGLLHFDKLNWKLTKSSESTWSDDLCDFAECEYRKLLSLKKWYPKLSFVPSKLVDKYWHEHILDTKSYLDDCNAVFGYFVHHYPYFGIYGDDDQSKLQVAYDQTVLLFGFHVKHVLEFDFLKSSAVFDKKVGWRFAPFMYCPPCCVQHQVGFLNGLEKTGKSDGL